MLEKFSAADRRFVLACLAAIAVCAAIGIPLFPRAFPEAALDLKVRPKEAMEIASTGPLREAGLPAAAVRREEGWRRAFRFAVDETPKVYLERTLGLRQANPLFGKQAKVWRWEIRWFRSGQKEEWRASVTPLGDLIGFSHILPEDAPGARLATPEAEALAGKFLSSRGLPPDSLDRVQSTPKTLPRRIDWELAFERRGLRLGEATVRYRVRIQGDRVGGYSEYVKVPERWERDYARLRSANDTASQVDALFLLLTIAAMVAVLVQKAIRRDVPWKLVLGFSAAGFLLALLSIVNGFPVSAFDYQTSSPYSSFLFSRITLALLSALGQGVLIGIVVASGEPVFRRQFPERIAIPRLFSRRGLRSRTCFRGILLGYALTAFFFAYQAVFYVAASHLGAWAPAEVPYDDILNTSLPWATVLFMGFFPAVSEEFISRIFSISFLRGLSRSRVLAVVLPAFIWGFGHSGYPNQPFFIRGLEVGLAGILVGVVFWRYGIVPILVWHFTVDATYTALLLLRSGNPYYVISGAMSAGVLLVPLLASVVALRRRGGFELENGLTNADVGVAPEPARAAAESPAEERERPLPRRRVLTALAFLVPFGLLFLFPSGVPGDRDEDAIGRRGAIASATSFLRNNGADPSAFRLASYTATGFAEEGDMLPARPEESATFAGFSEEAARYVLQRGGTKAFDRLSRHELPTALWAVRFVEPGRKSEWKILVRAATGRVAAFAHPLEESDRAPGRVDLESAKRRALAAADLLGYRDLGFAVVDAGTEVRPNRVDTRVVLESGRGAVAGASPRLVAVFHGGELSAFYPFLRVPEKYLRSRESQGIAYWLGVSVKLVAAGLLLGTVLWVVIDRLRSPGFRWRWLLAPVLFVGVIAIVEAANGSPQIWRAYRTEIPAALFRLSVAIGILIRAIGVAIAALVAFVLIDGIRPGWTRRWRFAGSPAQSFLRAALAAIGFAAAARLKGVLALRFPASFGAEPGLPASLNAAIPFLRIAASGAFRVLLLAAAAAAAALAARSRRFSDPRLRWLAAALLVVLALPLGAKSPGEAVWPTLAILATLGWAAFSFFALLSDDASAWIAFGALAILGGPALDLLAQPAPADRLQGGATIALASVVLLGALRRSRPAAGIVPPPAGFAGQGD